MINPEIPVDDLQRIAAEIRELRDMIAELGRPTGTQAYRAVEKLTALVEDIQDQLDAWVTTRWTNAQVEAAIEDRVDGALTPTTVSASGNITTPALVTGSAGLRSTGAYNQLVTYGGSYRALWVHVDGTVGYAPSSGRLKTKPEAFRVSVEDVLKLQAVTFRYLPTSPYGWGREELGGIAEDVAAAGFPWLVDYDENGEPFGIRHDLLSWVLLEGFRDLVARLLG